MGLFTTPSLTGFGDFQKRLKDRAFPTERHLFLPGSVDNTLTQGPADKPAQLVHFKFPGRALVATAFGTAGYLPA